MRAPAHLILFVIGFAATAAALQSLRPLPDERHLRPKVALWDDTAEAYDLVFLGSSRVQHAFDPRAFDARAKELGIDVRSFNFGIPGMLAHEADALLDRIFAAQDGEQRRLRYVLIEFPEFCEDFDRGNWAKTERALWWHDIGTTLASVRSAVVAKDTVANKLERTATHLRLCVANVTNYGAVTSVLESFPNPSTAAESASARQETMAELLDEMRSNAGYSQQASDVAPMNDEERQFSKLGSKVMEEFAPRIANQQRIGGDLEHFDVAALKRQIARAQRAGVEIVYVTLPTKVATPNAYRAAERGLLPHFLPLNDPDRHPGLFRTVLYRDGVHMRSSGAKALSRALAEAFAAEFAR